MAAHSEHTGTRRGNPMRPAVWGAAALLLLLPLAAMQFTADVDWTLLDFAVFGTMLLFACSGYELAAWVSGNRLYRAASSLAIAAGFLLTWVTLAVGILGSEHGPINLLYGGVLAVGIIGALIARFRAAGMARALVATAMAQVLVLLIAVATGAGSTLVATLATSFFATLWLASARLFGWVARASPTPPSS